jgi:hypothetical protein
LNRNQISFSRNKARNDKIFFENHLLAHTNDYDFGFTDIMKVKSFIVNANYNSECQGNSSNYIFNLPVLKEFTDYQLFLCNSELQQLVYKPFNCTPFYSSFNKKHRNECPIKVTILIFITMEKLRNELLNCEYSFAKQPIELLNIRHSDPFRSGFNFFGVDFNEVKLFERKLNKNQQYTFELIVNIGNILGLCVGFSVFKNL